MSNQQDVRKLIVNIFNENPSCRYKTIARLANVSRNTVSRVIKTYKQSLTIDRKPGSGRKSGFSDRKMAEKIKRMLFKYPYLSGRKVAQKAKCSETSVRKVEKEAGLRTYKVQKVPDRNLTKNLVAKQRAKVLQKDYLNNFQCCIMDDETYVLSDFKQLPGQKFYVADSRGNVAEEFRVQKKSKFPKKFLVWQAICTCGQRSRSFVTTGTINADVYIKECLQRRLLPLIKTHDLPSFFWPDLATCHYSKSAIEWYRTNGIRFVPKEANPPNCPELRPIERYWALVKKQLKDTRGSSKSESEFRKKWAPSSKKVTEATVKALMEGIPEKVKNFIKNN